VEAQTVHVPCGTELDLGATAKALAADDGARAILESTGSPVLVSLGGDIAVAGDPPAGGWPVLLADDHRTPVTAGGEIVHLAAGGLATSSTTVRRWSRGGRELHHILDPRTGEPVEPWWRTVTVAAGSCVEANTASTAGIVWRKEALKHLTAWRLPARLVAADGAIFRVGGWPEA
jgi:thiamine biosynthesis lipoprotein